MGETVYPTGLRIDFMHLAVYNSAYPLTGLWNLGGLLRVVEVSLSIALRRSRAGVRWPVFALWDSLSCLGYCAFAVITWELVRTHSDTRREYGCRTMHLLDDFDISTTSSSDYRDSGHTLRSMQYAVGMTIMTVFSTEATTTIDWSATIAFIIIPDFISRRRVQTELRTVSLSELASVSWISTRKASELDCVPRGNDTSAALSMGFFRCASGRLLTAKSPRSIP